MATQLNPLCPRAAPAFVALEQAAIAHGAVCAAAMPILSVALAGAVQAQASGA